MWTLPGGTAAGASNIVTVAAGSNPILRSDIVATGAGGTSIVSAGEINPLFGGSYVAPGERQGAAMLSPIASTQDFVVIDERVRQVTSGDLVAFVPHESFWSAEVFAERMASRRR